MKINEFSLPDNKEKNFLVSSFDSHLFVHKFKCLLNQFLLKQVKESYEFHTESVWF